MKNLLSVVAIASVILCGSAAEAAELPSYVMMGFPITPHQISIVGSANVEEQSPNPSLMLSGMPASPHQVAVLTPRPRIVEDLRSINPIATVSFSTR
jgi:hypothetical protein